MKLKGAQNPEIKDSQRSIWPAIEINKGLSSIPKCKNLTTYSLPTYPPALISGSLGLLWCELSLCYETVFPGIRSQAFRGCGKSERLFYFKTGRGSGV